MIEARAFDSSAPRRRVVVFADLVESVRLYEQFETRTMEHWRSFVVQVRESLAPQHGGRLVRTAGDGLLLEFETAPDATAAAFDFHRSLATSNGPEVGVAALWLRVGIHIADVVAEEHELWGSGVNLAARLGALAQPGQTAVSAEVRRALEDGVHADIEDLGPRYMKHISEPVRTFLLQPPGTGEHTPRAASGEDLRPVVAVIPFVALPADPAHDALGHAVADEVIASLSRHPGLRVLSRASTAAVRDHALDLPLLRTLLGASFLLSGHFYVRGTRVRLAAELCELRNGQVLWAGGATADVNALFEGQDELVPHLVGQVTQHVLAHELARVRSLPMNSLASYSLLLGANGLLNSLVPSDFARAREVLDHLADRHPRQAAPRALLSSWHVFKILQGWTDDAKSEAQHALREARQAMDNDPDQPAALVADGVARIFAERDFAGAQARYRRALALDPHHAYAWARYSETQTEDGDHEGALKSVSRAIELSPLDPQRFVYESFAARAAWRIGHYEMAARHARESIRRHAVHAPPHRVLIASLWLNGQQDAARHATANYLRLLPNARVSGSPSVAGAGAVSTPFAQALLEAGVPL